MKDTFLRRLFFSFQYLGKPRWDTGVSPPELLAFIQSHPPGNALDLGCGTGTNLITLARAGWKVTGVDYVPRAIRIARRHFIEDKIDGQLFLGDLTAIAELKEKKFNLILDIGCYHGMPLGLRCKYQELVDGWLDMPGDFLLYGFISSAPKTHGIFPDDEVAFTNLFNLVEKKVGTDFGSTISAWWHFTRRHD